jgi:hypothetical protein
LNNLFDNVSGSEATSGTVEYRCLYIQNTHATDAWKNLKTWIDTETTSTDTQIALGVDMNGVGQEALIADETATQFNGLMIEAESENYMLYSEDYTNAAWTKGQVTISTFFEGPDQVAAASGMVGTASSGNHYVEQTAVASAGCDAIASVYVKPGDKDWILLQVDGSATNTYFDISNLVVGTSSAGSAGFYGGEYGGGWCRPYCTVVAGGGNLLGRCFSAVSDGTLSFVGDGTTVNTYIYAFQTEEYRLLPTSYIKTTAATATRTAETLTYASASNVDNSAGEFTLEFFVPGETIPQTNSTFFSIDDGATTYNLDLRVDAATGYLTLVIDHTSFGTQTISTSSSVCDGSAHYVKVTWDVTGSIYLYVDGTSIGSYATGGVAAFGFTQISISPDHATVLVRDVRSYNSSGTLLFSALDGLSGVAAIGTNVTLNSTEVAPTLQYAGVDAQASIWPSMVGNQLVIAGTGTSPDLDRLAYGHDDYNREVIFNSGKYYSDSQGMVGDSDWVKVYVYRFRYDTAATEYMMADGTAAPASSIFSISNFMYSQVQGSGGSTFISTANDPGALYIHFEYCNKDEASTNSFRVATNGALNATGRQVNTYGTFLGSNFRIGVQGTLYPWSGSFQYFACYNQSSWHQAGASGVTDFDNWQKEITWKFSNIYPSYAAGSYTPTHTRTFMAFSEQYDHASGDAVLVRTGGGLARMASVAMSSPGPAGISFSRPLTEGTAINIVSSMAAGAEVGLWVKRTVSASASAIDPDGGTIAIQGTST